MNSRQLFTEIMFYGDYDRMPVWHWTGWPETTARWLKEGLPAEGDIHKFLGTEPIPTANGVPVNNGLLPGFAEETIEETAEYRIFRQSDGVIAQHWKSKSCIPHYVDFILKDRAGWAEYKKRLQPHPDRIPKNLDEIALRLNNLDQPTCVGTGSMMGWLRNWMGVFNFSYIQFDDRDLFAEMVDTIADLVIWCLDQVLPKVKVDMGWGWEDICGKSGPLVSMEVYRECVVPAYRRISDKLLEYDVRLHATDCDGLVEPLIEGWLEGGVNLMFPIEIGTWKADPAALRKRFGKEMRVFGGIDKLELCKGPAAIDAEIARRIPLMREGGFIPLPDHLITPECSLENYRYYLRRLGEIRL